MIVADDVTKQRMDPDSHHQQDHMSQEETTRYPRVLGDPRFWYVVVVNIAPTVFTWNGKWELLYILTFYWLESLILTLWLSVQAFVAVSKLPSGNEERQTMWENTSTLLFLIGLLQGIFLMGLALLATGVRGTFDIPEGFTLIDVFQQLPIILSQPTLLSSVGIILITSGWFIIRPQRAITTATLWVNWALLILRVAPFAGLLIVSGTLLFVFPHLSLLVLVGSKILVDFCAFVALRSSPSLSPLSEKSHLV